jgi:hypothetical protein
MLVDDAAPLRVGVGAIVSAWGRSIDGYAETDQVPFICGSVNEMQIARTEPVGDAAALFVEGGLLLTDGPVAV